MSEVVLETNLGGVNLLKRGKVRDVYEIDEKLLIVATDRISAFDVILPNGIPGKGEVLTQISLFWFDKTKNIIQNHIITADINEYPSQLKQYIKLLQKRSMLVKKTEPILIECIVRGYISGSGWLEYKQTGKICGIELPKNLKESQKLPEPIFTPSTKAESGHDQNITFEQMSNMIGNDIASQIKDISLKIYDKASQYALEKGIIIADTKMEFGFYNGKLMLIDELLTPDSSRFWLVETYKEGQPQDSFDKQIVRDYLLTLDWNKTYPGPVLPDNIVEKTAKRYKEILEMLTR
ncbi:MULTISPECIES: phosphoribosylaminoimidazolesuccinocarboxamide synthase [Desulfurella]|uniref:phosphoribosylaminoimidazolesuccinocarboxamide synthase n=1 Tax=Desulfurella TaxID=33001 RepID=UPI0003E0BCA5|nr:MULTISPECIES: phosphoribosylaminoimidazolesuccinocarboxamide synthase [Desulfurella]AHF96718.1 phosphoribosylaminoimidazole-succinocarboxamide synthase [Desulfurella acetivorans A63]PMP67940.1 MAG: phosphoribosylaminoimidazolesuccinocarboxamide synthase [Desulfurella multipotens]PMP91595.1 MAG: phosphoribosylaminoimidazolesuccinocarboxamide synthase [Desulfurella sp.]